MIWTLLFSVVKKSVVGIFLAITAFAVINYLFEVSYRARESKWYTNFPSHAGAGYVIKYAYVAEDWIFIKLYATGSNELLAERTYNMLVVRNLLG